MVDKGWFRLSCKCTLNDIVIYQSFDESGVSGHNGVENIIGIETQVP